MKLVTIFGGLDPEVTARVVSRRDAVARSGRMAGALAIASMPVAFGLFARKAFAQGTLPAEIVDVLNFALTLEYLEDEFYRTGLDADTAGVLDLGDTRTVFEQISKHETAHVALLQGVLGGDAGRIHVKAGAIELVLQVLERQREVEDVDDLRGKRALR
ncbi:MAG TPA: ferritin-like domain-containing protein, partial [Gemmatimonadales bacterium]|nr:ferritin-like domain-containing protein [Gemmatimonadales bacterium]